MARRVSTPIKALNQGNEGWRPSFPRLFSPYGTKGRPAMQHLKKEEWSLMIGNPAGTHKT
jgi:hypothetical protein